MELSATVNPIQDATLEAGVERDQHNKIGPDQYKSKGTDRVRCPDINGHSSGKIDIARIKRLRSEMGQIDIPMHKKIHQAPRFDPWFMKCDHKIIKYDQRGLGVWRALVSASHTILSDWYTWRHILFLCGVALVSFLITYFAGSSKSVGDNDQVTGRIQLLISFILSAYISLVISRWDRVRNTYIATFWNALENLNLIALQVLSSQHQQAQSGASIGTGVGTGAGAGAGAGSNPDVGSSGGSCGAASGAIAHTPPVVHTQTASLPALCDKAELLADELLRHSQLCMLLIFYAQQKRADLSALGGIDYNVLTPVEREWLLPATLGTRPLVVTTWIAEFFNDLPRHGYKLSPLLQTMVAFNVTNIRGGMGGAFAAIGTQLPYPYVHLVYWTIQVLLVSVFIQTGVTLAVSTYTKANGDGQYSPPDDDGYGPWPQNQNIWYFNNMLQILCGDVIFALFCEGVLNICDKLSNPMSEEDTSFSERIYAAVLYNNCKAMRAGFLSYQTFPKLLPSSTSGGGGAAAAAAASGTGGGGAKHRTLPQQSSGAASASAAAVEGAASGTGATSGSGTGHGVRDNTSDSHAATYEALGFIN